MRSLIAAVALAFACTGLGYARYAAPRCATAVVTVVEGSRDRQLHGKARRRARQGR